jgi:hypothetical protein
MAKVKMICPRCGSDDVTRDGLARRSLEEQKWEISSELDCMQCEACEEELGSEGFEEVVVPDLEFSSEDEPAIFATRYEDSHGDVETRTFRTRALALAWQADIGRRNWDDERDGPPPDDVGAAWFELQADRGQASFSVTPCRLEG